MEVPPFIASTVTLTTLAKNIAKLLRDGKHVTKHLQENRGDLEELQDVILRVEELLERPDMESNFAGFSERIVEAAQKDFESCKRFISELLTSNETSLKARLKRITVPNRERDTYVALRRKRTDYIVRAHISLQMLHLDDLTENWLMLEDFICFFRNHDLYYIFAQLRIICMYGHSQLKTGHPVRSAIHKQLNGKLVLRWVTTWESLLLYILTFCFSFTNN
ncbi:hypothetical protein KCV07_g9987, partial [Aureobasidium melanogenum]